MNLVMRKQWSRGEWGAENPVGGADSVQPNSTVAEEAARERTWQKRDSGYSCGTTKP